MGPAFYGLMIGLPSWREWGSNKWGSRDYYRRPWEASADMFGGVKSRSGCYRPLADDDKRTAWWYFGLSTIFGPLGYFFLI